MRNDPDRESGVTYVGPRAFIVGFTLVCAFLLAVLYGAGRVTEALETPESMSAPGALAANVTDTVATADPAAPSSREAHDRAVVTRRETPIGFKPTSPAPVALETSAPESGVLERGTSAPSQSPRSTPAPMAMQRFTPAPVAMQRSTPAPVAMQRSTPAPVTRRLVVGVPPRPVRANMATTTPTFGRKPSTSVQAIAGQAASRSTLRRPVTIVSTRPPASRNRPRVIAHSLRVSKPKAVVALRPLAASKRLGAATILVPFRSSAALPSASALAPNGAANASLLVTPSSNVPLSAPAPPK